MNYDQSIEAFAAGKRRVRRLPQSLSLGTITKLVSGVFHRQVQIIERARLTGSGPPPADLEQQLEASALELDHFLAAANGHPVVALGGASRNSVTLNPAVAGCCEAMSLIGALCYRVGIGAISGHYWNGWMWHSLSSWLLARQKRLAEREEDGVFIAGVPLLLGEVSHLPVNSKPSPEQEALLRLVDYVGPGQVALESRAPLIYLPGVPLISLYGPDGIGTACEILRDLEAEQHAPFALTWWTDRPRKATRKMMFLDCRMPNGTWNFDWLRLKASNSSLLGSTADLDWSNLSLLRVGDPSTDGGMLANLEPCPLKVQWFSNNWDLSVHAVSEALWVYDQLMAS